jgi:hypothetical protein
MASGLIPVARNAGGAPEIWPSHLDTLLPAESRGKQFAELLEKTLLLPRDQMLQLKHTVRAHAQTTFSIERQSKKFLTFISSKPFNRKQL